MDEFCLVSTLCCHCPPKNSHGYRLERREIQVYLALGHVCTRNRLVASHTSAHTNSEDLRRGEERKGGHAQKLWSLIVVEISIILFGRMLMLRIVQHGNLPRNCFSIDLSNIPPLPEVQPNVHATWRGYMKGRIYHGRERERSEDATNEAKGNKAEQAPRGRPVIRW